MRFIILYIILYSCLSQAFTYDEYIFVVNSIIPQTKGEGWQGEEFKQKYYSKDKLVDLYRSIKTYGKFYDIDSIWLLANAIQQSKLKHTAVGDHGTSFGIFQIHCPDNGVYKCKNGKKKLFDVVLNTHVFTQWASIRKQKCLSNMSKDCIRAKELMGEPIIFGSIKATALLKKKIDRILKICRLQLTAGNGFNSGKLFPIL